MARTREFIKLLQIRPRSGIVIAKCFLVWLFYIFATSSFCQEIDYKKTKARVTYEMKSIWLDIGPIELATIYINGEINNDAVLLVKKAYEKIKILGILNVELNSPGGSVDAALAIGRFFREKNAFV